MACGTISSMMMNSWDFEKVKHREKQKSVIENDFENEVRHQPKTTKKMIQERPLQIGSAEHHKARYPWTCLSEVGKTAVETSKEWVWENVQE